MKRLALLSLLALAACAPQGDFGRPKANVINDEILPTAGLGAAFMRNEPVSLFNYTDAERDMRSLGYGIVMPHEHQNGWSHFWAEMKRTRLASNAMPWPDPRSYCDTLVERSTRSSLSRYSLLISDIRADRSRIIPFFSKARLVVERDRIRERSFAGASELKDSDYINAQHRIGENLNVIASVRRGLGDRVTGYRCALERLVVSTPEQEAVLAEREIQALEEDIRAFAQLEARGTLEVMPGSTHTRPYYPMRPKADAPVDQK